MKRLLCTLLSLIALVAALSACSTPAPGTAPNTTPNEDPAANVKTVEKDGVLWREEYNKDGTLRYLHKLDGQGQIVETHSFFFQNDTQKPQEIEYFENGQSVRRLTSKFYDDGKLKEECFSTGGQITHFLQYEYDGDRLAIKRELNSYQVEDHRWEYAADGSHTRTDRQQDGRYVYSYDADDTLLTLRKITGLENRTVFLCTYKADLSYTKDNYAVEGFHQSTQTYDKNDVLQHEKRYNSLGEVGGERVAVRDAAGAIIGYTDTEFLNAADRTPSVVSRLDALQRFLEVDHYDDEGNVCWSYLYEYLDDTDKCTRELQKGPDGQLWGENRYEYHADGWLQYTVTYDNGRPYMRQEFDKDGLLIKTEEVKDEQ